MPAPWPETEEESEAKRPRVSDENTRSRECRRSIQSAGGICWSSADLAVAAKLLETPNARFPSITFSNMEEKRRVFTLVYDVLRYKSVLNQALNDVYFFTRYSYLKERCHLVWLLFLDLYKRDFAVRDPLEPEVEAAFQAQRLFEIDELLWQLRVKLAATVSRLRIKSGAHSLSNLLPHHLQATRSAAEENVISGWVNIFKTSLKDTCAYLENCGFMVLPRDKEALEPLTYKTDHILPRYLHIMPNAREDLVDSPLLQNHHIIMQEHTFCLGPAVIAQLLKDYALSGKVAQTHVNSPITMAYFANLLSNNDRIESLLVFGAGYRKEACQQYLKELGVKNTIVFSENFASLSPESRVLDNVIAVLATPPNTNSSVVDPVDLAVARGGDLQILQQLTDDDFASTPRGDNIDKLLREQRDTLRRGMSKPQIQFIVYETHSRFYCENEEMANNLVNELNNYAREVHLEELRRAQGESQDRERSQVETSESSEVPTIKVEEELVIPLPTPTPSVQSVQIPPSDLFEIGDLPDLCPNLDNCLDLPSEGTYIAVIKRKEITRLDPKYMIQMAEARGLFGRPDATPKAKTAGQTARAKAALAALQARSDSFEKSKTKVKVEMDRITAPTRASLLRDIHPPTSKDCPRYTHHLSHDGTPSYMCPGPEPRKTFLTAEEEEELIRRLYICPRLNLFSPKLYEDLPPLQFWNSPASVIESYLQRKVFQKRLQMAYEFNQSKETYEQHLFPDVAEEKPDQFSNAVNQLADDFSYFTYLTNQGYTAETMKIEDTDQRNKELWEEISPKESFAATQENAKSIEDKEEFIIKTKSKLHDKIKKRISDYNNFYRLQNLPIDMKPPLALTIDKTAHLSEESLGSSSRSDQEEHRATILRESIIKVEDFSKSYSEEYEDSVSYPDKLPQLPQVSEQKLPNAEDIQKILKNVQNVSDDLDSLLPHVPRNIPTHVSTSLTLRDSVELAHKRMSSFIRGSRSSQDFSNILPPPLPKASYKDSYMILADKLTKAHHESLESSTHITDALKNDINMTAMIDEKDKGGTILDHQDSLQLAVKRICSKEKPNGNEELSCDLCNNDSTKSLHFLCDVHASTVRSEQQTQVSNGTTILSSNKSCLSVKCRDSVVIAKKKISLKENKVSFACQVNAANIQEELQRKKMTTQNHESTKKGNLKKNPSKLKTYLMSAVQISRVNK